MEEKISILIPTYNSKNTIKETLNCILNQSYKNIEILIIDDGSKDDTVDIIKSYMEKDNRIVFYHRENKGVAITRNELIEKCKTNYFVFIDSDDIVSEKYIETLYNVLKENNADIVSCEITFNKDDLLNDKFEKRVLNKEEALEKLLYQKEIQNGPTCKMYSKKCFEGVRFPEGVIYEDLATIYRLIHNSEIIVTTTYRGYYYNRVEGSITRSKFSEREIVMVDFSLEIYDFIMKEYSSNKNLVKAAENMILTQAIFFAIKAPYKVLKENPRVKENIIKYRKNVLKDEKAFRKTKIYIISSYMGITGIKVVNWLLSLIGKGEK